MKLSEQLQQDLDSGDSGLALIGYPQRAEALEDKLKWAYCKEIDADSIIGLDCCDDYRDWIESLGS